MLDVADVRLVSIGTLLHNEVTCEATCKKRRTGGNDAAGVVHADIVDGGVAANDGEIELEIEM